MALVAPTFEQLPTAFSPAQIETHVQQQTNGDIPGFVIAHVGADFAAAHEQFSEYLSPHEWTPYKGSEPTVAYAIGFRSGDYAAAAIKAMGIGEAPVATTDRQAHFDGTMLPSYATTVFSVVLGGEYLALAFEFTDEFKAANYTNHDNDEETKLRAQIKKVLRDYEYDNKLDTDLFKPVIKWADVRPGQAFSLTIQGPEQVPHKFKSTKTPRTSVTYDFNRVV